MERIGLDIAGHESFKRSGVTASIGAVNFNKAPDHIEEIINQADKAIYSVKGQGKNLVYIEDYENNQETLLSLI